MPVSSIQFRETIGKYEKKKLLPINKPIRYLGLKNPTKLSEITKIAVDCFPKENSRIDFQTENFLKIAIKNQNAVKTSLVLLLFLQNIGVTSGELSVTNSNFDNSSSKGSDENLSMNSFRSSEFPSPINQNFHSIRHHKTSFDNSSSKGSDENLSMNSFRSSEFPSPINQNFHSIRHHKTRYFSDRIFLQVTKKLYHFLKRQKILGRKTTKEEVICHVVKYSTLGPQHLKRIARKILFVMRLYEPEKVESLSVRQSEALISTWIFKTMLDRSPTEYIARIIGRDPHKLDYTISDVIHLLSVEKLEQEGIINLKKLSEENQSYFEIIWNNFIEKELPFIHFYNRDNNIGTIPLDDLKFSNLYTGARYLSELTALYQFNSSEVLVLGRKMWENAASDGISTTTKPYFLTPSLFFEAQNAAQKINQAKDINNIAETAIIDQLTYHEIAQQINKSIMSKLNVFKELLTKWSKMGQDLKDVDNEEYRELICKMKDSFSELDEYLLVAGLNSASSDEKHFIFSPDAIVSPVTVSKKRKNIKITITPFYGMQCYHENLRSISCKDSLPETVILDRADLFSSRIGQEERIYALKNKNTSYEIIRLDRDISKYIELEIFDSAEIKNAQIINKNEMKIAGKIFYFEFFTHKNFFTKKDSIIKSMNFFINKHSDDLYNSLYQAGNHPSTLGKIWNILKHFIPLYDCVDGVLHHNMEQAVPSCLLDALLISPLLEGSQKMVAEVALSIAKGIRRTEISLPKNFVSFVSSGSALLKEINFSTISEVGTIKKNIYNSLDSGFEFFGETSKKYRDTLINYLNKDEKTVSLAEKIRNIASEKSVNSFSDAYITARLPNSEVRVPIRKIGEKEGREIYTVFNPETSETAWGRFVLQENNQLVLLEASPLSISKDFEKFITEDMYARDIDIHALSEPDYMGLRWDYDHLNGYINHKSNWLKVKILNNQLFLATERSTIPLIIKNYELNLEGFFDRILRLQKQGFAGTKLTAKKVIADKLNISEREATDLLNKYEFPAISNHYTTETFALWIEKTGRIPFWAESFEILNRDSYISRFESGDIQYNGLYSFYGGDGFVYRVDRTPPDVILYQGFTPTEDYGALEKMIPDNQPGLTVAGGLTGALRYNEWVKSPYIYKIKLEDIRGVSLKENLMKNPRGLKSFLGENPDETYSTIESLAQDCNGAIYLDEIHLYSNDIKPAYISLVTQEEIERELPLAEGSWKNYL